MTTYKQAYKFIATLICSIQKLEMTAIQKSEEIDKMAGYLSVEMKILDQQNKREVKTK